MHILGNDFKRKVSEKEKTFRILGKEMNLWKYGFALKYRCRQVFRDLSFNGKTMLEIGCGKGIFCIWAKIKGAENVIGLEPLSDGTVESSQVYKDFKKIKNKLDFKRVEMLPLKIQDFECEAGMFDIILSHGSINHLDEESCIKLKDNSEAKESYMNIFKKLNKILKNGGKLIIIECSNRNFFSDRGMKNPFAKTIEWHKHQEPEVWAELLTQCGFGNIKITWNSGRLLRYLRIYSIFRCLAFRSSSFRLEMTKTGFSVK